MKSPAFSFEGWDIWEFLKGRKKTAVTIVGVILGYWIMDSATIAIASGGIVEAVFAITEYFIKARE